MEFVLLFFYLACFAFLTWRNFRWGIFWLTLSLPAYLIRFDLGSLPTTLLEVNFGVIFLIWLIKYSKNDWPIIKEKIKKQKAFFLFVFLFFLSSVISVFWGAHDDPHLLYSILKGLGWWRAYFLEPILLFFVLIGRTRQIPNNSSEISQKDLINFLIISSISVAVLTLIQRFTGWLYPPSLWNDDLSGRPTSFFTSPNAIGLYLAPIALLAAPSLTRWITKNGNEGDWWRSLIFVLNVLAVMVSFSQGAWAALFGGLLIFVFLIGKQKIAAGAMVFVIFLILLTPNIRSAFLFQDQAGQNRLTLWRYSMEYLTASPQKFILGCGLRQFFNEVQRPHYDKEELERLIYPHNIFLNFWLESGLLGMISFSVFLIYLFIATVKTLKQDRFLSAALTGAIIAFTLHGLVDVPYFKNDLAMIFWILVVIMLSNFKSETEATR